MRDLLIGFAVALMIYATVVAAVVIGEAWETIRHHRREFWKQHKW